MGSWRLHSSPAAARASARRPAHLAENRDTVILADINVEAADNVAAAIVASGGKAESAALDVRDGGAFAASSTGWWPITEGST